MAFSGGEREWWITSGQEPRRLPHFVSSKIVNPVNPASVDPRAADSSRRGERDSAGSSRRSR